MDLFFGNPFREDGSVDWQEVILSAIMLALIPLTILGAAMM